MIGLKTVILPLATQINEVLLFFCSQKMLRL